MPDAPAPVQQLRLLLGDQLDIQHSWFSEINPQTLYVLAELPQELRYTHHHQQKICAFLLAMAEFARALQQRGHRVCLLTLDETMAYSDLPALLQSLCQRYQAKRLAYQRPDEYRLMQQLAALSIPGVKVLCTESEHFLLPFSELPRFFTPGTAHTMEGFYRRMRRRTGWLMAGKHPTGGQWNYDKENRSPLTSAGLASLPSPLCFDNKVKEIADRLDRHGIPTMGHRSERCLWPVNRDQALQLLAFFCEHLLPSFGRFQDAMTEHSEHAWSLYHSRLSFALNSKMLRPAEVIEAVLAAWQARDSDISLPQVEGFVRQILGWREFIRGMYWSNMPGYAQQNRLQAQRPLPGWFWTGKTRMRCLHKAISQSLEKAYAHHIQRLMVTGNFAALAGIDPVAVDQWYLGVYVDAIEWVELPNTRGMSQWADGGLIATKPYVSSGAYIHRMSDHCRHCHYKVQKKTGEDACPFNSLYWHYIDRHQDRFRSNRRMAMIVAAWAKRDPQEKTVLLAQAEQYLQALETL